MSATAHRERLRFYPLIALALAAFSIIAFSRTYFLRFLSDRPPLHAILHVHGLVLTAWVVLFAVQTRLVAMRRIDLHKKLGVSGALLAVLVVATSTAAMFLSAATPRTTQLGLTATQATIVPLSAIVPFTVLVAAGVAWRRRASLHKRFMLLAMISMLGPPSVRLIAWLGVRQYALPIQMSVFAAFVSVALVCDWRKHGVVHPVFAIGGVVLVLLLPARLVIARSQMWQPVGEWIAEVGRRLLY